MKLRKSLSVIIALMLMLTMVACGNSSSDSAYDVEVEADAAAETDDTVEVEDDAVDTEEDTNVEETDELESIVVIYSTHGESMLELVADEFEAATGVKVEFINLKGELADRVRAEKDNPQSDVMFGGSSAVFMELQAEDLFESYKPSWGDKVDPLFKDADYNWIGTIQTPVMMFYNNEVIAAEDAPTDWADLTDERFADQLVFRNALSSSARATYSSLLQFYEKNESLDAGWEYLKALDANTKQYFNSGSLMFQALGRQEAGVSFATLNSIIDNRDNNNLPLEIVNATSGSPIITDGIALINNAKHPNAAKAFIDFAGSAEIQALFANEFNRMPTNADAFASSPEWMSNIEIKPMGVDWADLATKQSDWMQVWDADVKDVDKDAE